MFTLGTLADSYNILVPPGMSNFHLPTYCHNSGIQKVKI